MRFGNGLAKKQRLKTVSLFTLKMMSYQPHRLTAALTLWRLMQDTFAQPLQAHAGHFCSACEGSYIYICVCVLSHLLLASAGSCKACFLSLCRLIHISIVAFFSVYAYARYFLSLCRLIHTFSMAFVFSLRSSYNMFSSFL